MFKPFKEEKAFSLLEVMISLVILSVGLLATLSLTISAVRGNSFGKQMTVASTLAEDKLEELKKLPYSSATLNAGTTTESDLGPYGGTGPFQRVTVVTDDSPVADMKTIDVTINWTDQESRSITISTLLSQ